MKKVPLGVVIALFSFTNIVLADKIILKNGNELEGKILEKTENSVRFEFANGTRKGEMTLPQSSVKKIIYTISTSNDEILADYKKQLTQVEKNSADAWYKLGLWCKKRSIKLAVEEKNAYRKSIEINPSHTNSRLALGYQIYKGKWMTEDEIMQAKGYVLFEGVWQKPSEVKETIGKRKQEINETKTEIENLKKEFETLKIDSTQNVIYEKGTIPNSDKLNNKLPENNR